MNKLDFYFDVIDGKQSLDISMFQDEPPEDREGLVLGYAFDAIVEIGEKNGVNERYLSKLMSYVDENIDIYSAKKDCALMSSGYLANTNIEPLLIKYLDSKHPDLVFASFSSICEMAKRKVLSDETFNFFIDYLEKRLNKRTISNEEVIEVIVMLNGLSFPKKESLVKLIKNYPEAVREADQLL